MYMEEEHGISPHMLNSTSLVCNVSLFVFSSQLLFRFLLSPLQLLLSLLLFLFSSFLSRFFTIGLRAVIAYHDVICA